MARGMIPFSREEVYDELNYTVVLPSGLMRNIKGERLRALPHWKHCRGERDPSYRSEIYLRLNDDSISGERVFVFGRSQTSLLGELQTMRDRVIETREQICAQESLLLVRQAEQEAVRLQFVADGRARKTNSEVVRSKFSIERLRETLLSQEDILDVRFGGEPCLDQNLEYLTDAVVNANVMLVTFIGPSIRYGTHGVCPTPPLQFQFFLNGVVKGGNLAIHPHVRPGDMCYGNAARVFERIVERGDTYAAVDMARTYRLGFDATSPLVREWRTYVWNWWAVKFSRGWPESEPFMKPWMSLGFPVVDNITGKTHTLAKVLGTDDPKDMLTAIHLGLQNDGWYKRTTWTPQLKDMGGIWQQATRIGTRQCACGRIHPDEEIAGTDDRPMCLCHGRSAAFAYSLHPCTVCNRAADFCQCSWFDRGAWRLTRAGVYCEAPLVPNNEIRTNRTVCHVYGDRQSPPLAMWQLTGSHTGYRGPSIVCANHLPDAPPLVHCPDCLADHPADRCPLFMAPPPPRGTVMNGYESRADDEPALDRGARCVNCNFTWGHHYGDRCTLAEDSPYYQLASATPFVDDDAELEETYCERCGVDGHADEDHEDGADYDSREEADEEDYTDNEYASDDEPDEVLADVGVPATTAER